MENLGTFEEDIVLVNYKNDMPAVSARELYNKLEIAERFSKWFDRMIGYGFEVGIDYTPYQMVHPQNKQEFIDYDLTIDMAKQICMLQRSEKGTQYRQYFLKIEKAWNTPEAVMARALQMATTTIEKLEGKVDSLLEVIEEQKPMVEFANHVTTSSDTVDIGELSKIIKNENIDIGRNRLFKWLRENKILMNNNLPYQTYLTKGWFEVIETTKDTAYGIKLFSKVLVKGKGQVGIVEKLRKDNTRTA